MPPCAATAPEPLKTRDLRIESIRPLVPPAILLEELPLSAEGAETVSAARERVSRILRGEDDRLVVVVGPCSIHDTRRRARRTPIVSNRSRTNSPPISAS